MLARGLQPHHRYLVEKTPGHVERMPVIAAAFPDARFIRVLRDGRDVCVSRRAAQQSWAKSWRRLPGPLGLARSAHTWDRLIGAGRAGAELLPGRVLEVRYEELWQDRSMALWSDILDFLGFDERERELCRSCFWEHSLFGEAGRANRRHARSGEVAQWKNEFTPELARAFVYHFPDALRVLGYETDERWIEELEKTAKPRADSMARDP